MEVVKQKKIVLDSFSVKPKTMKMVSVETGVDRANICRYVGDGWKKME